MIKNKGKKRINTITLIILLGVLVIMGIIMGYLSYTLINPEENTEGLYTGNFCGYEGNWVHIKIRKDMGYKRGVEICNHEVGHALFCKLNDGRCYLKDGIDGVISENYAEVCEVNPKLCLNDEEFLE